MSRATRHDEHATGFDALLLKLSTIEAQVWPVDTGATDCRLLLLAFTALLIHAFSFHPLTFPFDPGQSPSRGLTKGISMQTC